MSMLLRTIKQKEKQHTGKEIEYNILTLIKKYEDMFDIKQLSDQEYRLISILNVIMLTEASFVVFGMEATDMHENLLLMIEDYKENSLNCKLETIIFMKMKTIVLHMVGLMSFQHIK